MAVFSREEKFRKKSRMFSKKVGPKNVFSSSHNLIKWYISRLGHFELGSFSGAVLQNTSWFLEGSTPLLLEKYPPLLGMALKSSTHLSSPPSPICMTTMTIHHK